MPNNAIARLNFNLPHDAPITIDEIGDRTFRVKERLWAFNTLGNLKYIWCSRHMGCPQHWLGEMDSINMRKKQILDKKDVNWEADIKSLDDKIAEFKSTQCAECVEKAQTTLFSVHDKASGDALYIGGGPSVLGDYNGPGYILPKAAEQIKNYSGPIIACDRVLVPLLKIGIIPKYVVSADGADHVKQYFEHELVKRYAKDIMAIFNVQLHPSVTDLWVGYGGRIMWYNVALDELDKSKSLTRYLIHMTNDTPVSVPWGHVSGYGFGMAFLLGYNPVILYGVDLGFRESDPIEDTPYWNPYYKATAKEFIMRDLGMPLQKVPDSRSCEVCRRPLEGQRTVTAFNADNPEHMAKFFKIAKKYDYDDSAEYTSKSKHNEEIRNEVIKRHFHFYTNPLGNKVYHDHIFKAYKDIMLSFFINNPMAKIVQCSEYTTYFAEPCTQCKGALKVNTVIKEKKGCYKCKQVYLVDTVCPQQRCPRCLKDTGKKNAKGEPILEPCGIQANGIQCMSLQDFINSKVQA